jgi:hypothetical protein
MTWNVFKKKKNDSIVDLTRFDLEYSFSICINNSKLMELCSIGSYKKKIIDGKMMVDPVSITRWLRGENWTLYDLFKVCDPLFRSQVVICADSKEGTRPSVEYRLKDCSVSQYSSELDKRCGGLIKEKTIILPSDFELVVTGMVK